MGETEKVVKPRRVTTQLVDLEEMFNRVLASQQPFFSGLLGQISAMESRMERAEQQQQTFQRTLDLVAAAELQRKINDQDIRIAALETDRNKRTGMMELLNWVPKAVIWFGGIIAAVLAYAKLKTLGMV